MATANICNYQPIHTMSVRAIDDRFRTIYKYVCYLAAQASGGSPITNATLGLSQDGANVTLGYPAGTPVAESLFTDSRDIGLDGHSLGFIDNSTGNGTYTDGGTLLMLNSDVSQTFEANISGANNTLQLLNSNNQARFRYDDGTLTVETTNSQTVFLNTVGEVSITLTDNTANQPYILFSVTNPDQRIFMFNTEGVFGIANNFSESYFEFNVLTGSATVYNSIPDITENVDVFTVNSIGQINTTGGARTITGTVIINEATISSGANPLTNVGLQVSVSNGTNNYAALFSNGRVGVNNDTPTARLHIGAGTATANTAPIKFTAGTNLSTPENGAMEFDGTNLYITIAGTRRTINVT